MLATLLSATLVALDGRVIRVEVDVAPGLPGFTIVGLGDLVLSVLDHADEVHIVMTADLSCLKNVRLVLEALRKVGFDPKRLKLALNRSNAFTGISVGAAESALKREFETKITNEYRVAISAQNTGSPFAYSKPDSPLGREIVELAQAIDAVFAPQVTPGAGGAPARLGAGAAAR